MKVKFIAGPKHMKEDSTINVEHPGDLIKCGVDQEYILTVSEMRINGEKFKVAIPTIETLQAERRIRKSRNLFSPVIVCSTEQIEEFKKDPNFQKLPETGFFPVFQPNEVQLAKIKEILADADLFILTDKGFEQVL